MEYAMFQKPKFKRRVPKAKNNDKPTVDDICVICGTPYAHNHEIFFGKNRQLSIKYGLQIRLCLVHHEGDYGPHKDKNVNRQYKQQAQSKFVAEYGYEEFMMLFKRDYFIINEIFKI